MSARAWYVGARVLGVEERGRPWREGECANCRELVWVTAAAAREAHRSGAQLLCTACVPDVLPPGLALLVAELRELGR